STAVLTVISLPLSYYSEIVIEEKYGFNNSSAKTFIGDQIKGLIINALLNVGLVCLVIWAYGLMGNLMFVIVYAAIALFIIVFSMLSMTFQKIFNKFEPLPEGELRDTLTEMFARAGYKLSDILVMNASLRTKKVNAFCTGLGKFKKIVLYDNLVNNYTNGEIAAVFAHELGHYKHRDTAKLTVYNLFRIMFLVAIIAAVVVVPEISLDFGFAGVNLVFAVLVMTSGVTEPILTLVDIPMAIMSRKFEYRADAMAVSAGYGDDMISALTKLSRDNLSDLNPHPAIVALEYTHPTLSQRIAAVEKLGEGAK
ncbi:MAG: M48 family metallopeptidase, partial [Clostridia bacterium]|nr:M48 family metallopeptidase [Clostridia bacterium]